MFLCTYGQNEIKQSNHSSVKTINSNQKISSIATMIHPLFHSFPKKSAQPFHPLFL